MTRMTVKKHNDRIDNVIILFFRAIFLSIWFNFK